MKKNTLIKLLFVLFLLVPTLSFAKDSSTAACAIWICLPTGFPSGCGDARSEFKDRIKRGKSPLVSLSSCGDDETEASIKNERVLWVEPETCEYRYYGNCTPRDGYWEVNGTCKDLNGCISRRQTSIFISGEQVGDTFRY